MVPTHLPLNTKKMRSSGFKRLAPFFSFLYSSMTVLRDDEDGDGREDDEVRWRSACGPARVCRVTVR